MKFQWRGLSYMNKKGQILVMFIILLPLVLLMAAYTIDMGLVMYEKNHLEGINESTIDYAMEHFSSITEEKIKEIVAKNDQTITTKVIIGENQITIVLEKQIKSIFGNIIGINNYQIKSTEHSII